MRRERKKGILRRLVLGLAVAAVVAPAAQARLDSGTVPVGNAAEPSAVIHGDDKTFAPETNDYAGVLNGDDKTFAPKADGYAGLIHGDDKVIAPKTVYYTVAGLPRGLQDDGTRIETPVEAVRSPGSFDWGDALVGAGTAFGLMLLLGGAVLGTRHVRPTAA
jgi:hypothetical protein